MGDIPPFKEESPRASLRRAWAAERAAARLVSDPGKVTSNAEGPDEYLGVAAGTAQHPSQIMRWWRSLMRVKTGSVRSMDSDTNPV